MAFEVIPFCWIVKFSGITRFLYQFWKISPKYCGRKEKDHNILWSKWYSRRESNPQRPLRSRSLFLNTVKLRSNFRKMAQFFQLKRLLQSFLTTYFCRVTFKNIAFIWDLYQIYTNFLLRN